MYRKFLKSKIHGATITDSDIEYQGSITIDKDLMKLADLSPFEFVDVWDVTNGARFETYVIEGEAASGAICVNGAAARLVSKNDLIIIASHIYIEEDAPVPNPRIVFVDSANKPVSSQH